MKRVICLMVLVGLFVCLAQQPGARVAQNKRVVVTEQPGDEAVVEQVVVVVDSAIDVALGSDNPALKEKVRDRIHAKMMGRRGFGGGPCPGGGEEEGDDFECCGKGFGQHGFMPGMLILCFAFAWAAIVLIMWIITLFVISRGFTRVANSFKQNKQ